MSKIRKLTKTEIEYVLNFERPKLPIPKPILKSVRDTINAKLKKQLEKIEIYPELIPSLRDEIQKQYISSQIQAGESVGIISAQSVGEKQTQSNLNSFHKAGSSDRQPVESKFAELMNATQKPKVPNCMIYFKKGNSSIPELRETMGHSIVQLSVEKITKKYRLFLNKVPEQWYEAFEILENSNFRNYENCITLYCDMDVLYMYKLTLKEICDFFQSEYEDMACVYSPNCFGQIDIFVDTTNIELPEDAENYHSEDLVEFFLDSIIVPKLMEHVITGIPGIENVFFLQDGKTWYVETENTRIKPPDSVIRFKRILSQDIVDMTRTVSNNVWDIYHTFGIEAVRQFMIEEFSKIMPGINTCHVMLMVDKMTHGGTISSISRYTMRQDDAGVLASASFEETLDNFLKSAAYGKNDNITGVSASIICGTRVPIGTGMCDVKIDLEMLQNL